MQTLSIDWQNAHADTCAVTAARIDLLAELRKDPGNVYLHGAVPEYDCGGDQEVELCTCPLPAVGTRVRLRHDVDRFPHFIADEGMEGSVVHTPAGDPSGTFCVQMDEHLEGAEEWDNEIVWSVGDGDHPMGALEVIS